MIRRFSLLRSLPGVCFAAVWLFLPTLLSASEGGGETHADIGQILWPMGVKFLNFAIIAYLLFRFLSKPLASYVAARAETIRANLQELQQKRAASEEAAAALSARLKGIEEEIRALKEEARLEMEKEKEQIIAEAHRAAQDLVRHTQDAIKREFSKARAELFEEAVSGALAQARELMAGKVTERDQRRFAEDYIKRINPPS